MQPAHLAEVLGLDEVKAPSVSVVGGQMQRMYSHKSGVPFLIVGFGHDSISFGSQRENYQAASNPTRLRRIRASRTKPSTSAPHPSTCWAPERRISLSFSSPMLPRR